MRRCLGGRAPGDLPVSSVWVVQPVWPEGGEWTRGGREGRSPARGLLTWVSGPVPTRGVLAAPWAQALRVNPWVVSPSPSKKPWRRREVLWGGQRGHPLLAGQVTDSWRGLGQAGVCPQVQSLGPLKQERGWATGRHEVLGAAASDPMGLPELRTFRGLSGSAV